MNKRQENISRNIMTKNRERSNTKSNYDET